jgi:cell division protein FtsW (lipid II flippase)
MNRTTRRSQAGLVLAAAVIIIAGFGIALVAMLIDQYRWPKASIWGVVGVAALLVAVIRTVSTRKRRAGR